MDYENITERRILVFGDSNTYGYDPERDGRYGETERYPCRIQALLGPGWTVIEEGLPGRTAVFDDPVTEGLCGLSYLTPCMMSHAPLDTLVVMLGTNDTKERFGCNAYLIAQGIGRLLKKAADTDAWRDKPDILAVCPAPIVPAYESLVFRNALGGGCAEKASALAQELEPVVLQLGARFLDAGRVPGVEVCARCHSLSIGRMEAKFGKRNDCSTCHPHHQSAMHGGAYQYRLPSTKTDL